MAIPQNDPALCGLSWATKVIASGMAFTGRDADNIFRRSCNWMAAPDAMMKEALETKNPAALLALDPTIETHNGGDLVSVTLDGRTAWAKRFGDQGFSVVSDPGTEPSFVPTPIERPAATNGWPKGDPEAVDPGMTDLDTDLLQEASDLYFANPMQMTNAVVVLHKGQPVLERYREPYGRETQFESWSMGKSIAATLAGIAVRADQLRLDEAQLFDQWTDDRSAIAARDLLNMASGLEFTGSFGKDEDHSEKQRDGLFLDHIYVYASGCDAHDFCVNKPLADEPGTAGRYRNCDPILATSLVRERMVGGDVQRFLTWPYEHLFHKIGARGMILETDPYGNFLISGHDYGRAMDWARLGQLHLQRGAWGGDQIFDNVFAEFVRTPASAAWAHDPYYGGFFPTNATGIIPTLPRDAFWMSGGGRQRVMIVPSLDLVMVRMGHLSGVAFGLDDILNDAYGLIARSVKS
ncbi:MAG: serine hydrolase [Pseudomonadota bacterium]